MCRPATQYGRRSRSAKTLLSFRLIFEEYIKYSKLARSVYERYTDQVEPYGMDECWLDISGTSGIFGSPEKVANEIRETIKFELGLTISVGVSFNKNIRQARLGYEKAGRCYGD